MNLQINIKISGDCVQSEGVLAATDAALMEAAVLAPKRISRAARTCLDNINCVGTPRVGSGVLFTEGAVSFNLSIILEEGGKALDAVKFKEALEVELGVRPRNVLPAAQLQPKFPPQIADLSPAFESAEQGVQQSIDLAQERKETKSETEPLVEFVTHASREEWPEHAKELRGGDETPTEIEPPSNTSVPPGLLAAESESPEPSDDDQVHHQPVEAEAPTAKPDTLTEEHVASPQFDAEAPVEKQSSEEYGSTAILPNYAPDNTTAEPLAELRPLATADDGDQAIALVVEVDLMDALPALDSINVGTDPSEVRQAAEVTIRDLADLGLDPSAATTSELSPRLISSPAVGVEREAAPTAENFIRTPAVELPVRAIGEAGAATDACDDRGPARHDEAVALDAAGSCPAIPTPPLEILRLSPKPEMVTRIVVESCTAVTQAQLEGKGLPTLIVVVDPEMEEVERGMNFTSRLSGLETRHGRIYLLDAFEVEVDRT
ncbi:hypothetical protein [Arenimonas metalli]|nr:hypothetical protein [Arenimonas metalli]